MTIEEAIFSYLSTYPGLVALIGTKVYPDIVPQSQDLPAVTYTFISDDKPRSAVGGHDGISNDIFQIAAYGTTKSAVSAIKQQIRTALLTAAGNGYVGYMGTLYIQQCIDAGGIGDGYDNQALEYYSKVDYQFSYEY